MAVVYGHRGRRGRATGRTGSARAVALVVAAALVLASCTDYKSRLRAPDAPGAALAAGVVPPEPAEEKRSVWQGEKIAGWVHLRFDVSEAGEARDIAVVASSDPQLEARAVGKLAAWPFVPASRASAAEVFAPEAYRDLELVMVFYTDDTTTTAEAIGITLLVIVLIPVALVLAVLGGGGKFECCSN